MTCTNLCYWKIYIRYIFQEGYKHQSQCCPANHGAWTAKNSAICNIIVLNSVPVMFVPAPWLVCWLELVLWLLSGLSWSSAEHNYWIALFILYSAQLHLGLDPDPWLFLALLLHLPTGYHVWDWPLAISDFAPVLPMGHHAWESDSDPWLFHGFAFAFTHLIPCLGLWSWPLAIPDFVPALPMGYHVWESDPDPGYSWLCSCLAIWVSLLELVALLQNLSPGLLVSMSSQQLF